MNEEIENRLDETYRYLVGKKIVSTKKDVAEKMEYDYTTVSSAFNGRKGNLTKNFISAYNKAFGSIFSTDWIIDGVGEMLNDNLPISDPVSNKAEMPSVPYELVQAMIKSNEALSDERKRYDMERRELLSQQAKLIDMLDNRLSALEKSNASTVSSVPTSNSATAGENEK